MKLTMKPFLHNIFARATVMELAATELADAERDLLAASSAAEYADALIAFNTTRIDRLKSVLMVSVTGI